MQSRIKYKFAISFITFGRSQLNKHNWNIFDTFGSKKLSQIYTRIDFKCVSRKTIWDNILLYGVMTQDVVKIKNNFFVKNLKIHFYFLMDQKRKRLQFHDMIKSDMTKMWNNCWTCQKIWPQLKQERKTMINLAQKTWMICFCLRSRSVRGIFVTVCVMDLSWVAKVVFSVRLLKAVAFSK